MLISCEIGEEDYVYSQFQKIPEVKNCLVTYGSYDIVVELEAPKDLDSVISSKIRKLEKIRSTITLRVTS